jgi:hypothetical protein
MPIRSYHLPGITELPVRTEVLGPRGIAIEHGHLSKALLDCILDTLLAARSRALVERPVAEIIEVIVRLAELWCAAGSPWLTRAADGLHATTGLSHEMIARVLPGLFRSFTAEHLWAIVESEAGGASGLDGFVESPWGRCHAVGPDLIVHVSAGNVPGLSLPTVVMGLLAKSAVLLKPGAGEPVLAALVARSLAELDQEMGSCVAAAYWPGGTADLDQVILSRADVLIVEGSDESVAAIRSAAQGRVLGFGRRVSLAVVAREATSDIEGVAAAIARDVSLYDQQGCLSPQVVYVERGGAANPTEVAESIGKALISVARELPRGTLTSAEHVAVRSFREQAEWRAVAGEDTRVLGDPSDTGPTVLYEADPSFQPTCLNRTVRVKPLDRLEDLPAHLGSWAGLVEAIGAAGPEARIRDLALTLAGCSSASRICPLGQMQVPPLGWHHGGLPRLGSLLRWIDIESPEDER